MFRPSVIVAVSILLTPVVDIGAAFAAEHRCDAAVEQILQDLPGISARVESVSYNRQRAHGDGAENRTIGWDVWVRLAGFDGALVLDLTRRCNARQIYTRGKDTLPDIRSYCA